MIYIILGTKGQFMKMFPIMKLFDKHKVPYKFIHTSQHYGIIEESRKKLGVRRPDVYLTVKKEDLRNIWDLLIWAPKVLWNARKLKLKKKDWVLIHGDTESTFLALIIAKFFRARTAHIEAGGRSHNWLEPFPEEIIRALADNLCDIDFCPYPWDSANIRKKRGKYLTNGNTVFDSVRLALKVEPSEKAKNITKKKYVLFLIHRKENVFLQERLNSIMLILEEILKKKIKVVWPIHTNTKYELKKKKVWDKIVSLQSKYDLELNYFFDYVDFMHLVKSSEFVASDGGGLQKETFILNKPMLVLRKVLEREPGVGETSYLSYLNVNKVRKFLKIYRNCKTKEKYNNSPSEVIVNYFKKNP